MSESARASDARLTDSETGKAIGSADKDLQIQELTSSLTALRGACETLIQQWRTTPSCACISVEEACADQLSTALAVSRVPPISKEDDLTRTGELAADRPPQPASSNGKAWFLFIEERAGIKRPATPEEIYEFSQIMIAIAPQEWAQGLWQKPPLPPVDA